MCVCVCVCTFYLETPIRCVAFWFTIVFRIFHDEVTFLHSVVQSNRSMWYLKSKNSLAKSIIHWLGFSRVLAVSQQHHIFIIIAAFVHIFVVCTEHEIWLKTHLICLLLIGIKRSLALKISFVSQLIWNTHVAVTPQLNMPHIITSNHYAWWDLWMKCEWVCSLEPCKTQ